MQKWKFIAGFALAASGFAAEASAEIGVLAAVNRDMTFRKLCPVFITYLYKLFYIGGGRGYFGCCWKLYVSSFGLCKVNRSVRWSVMGYINN